jgi:large subunit ribosomal protein L2
MSVEVIRHHKVTNGSRHLVNLEKAVLLKDDRVFKLASKHQSRMGRSSITGHITAWHRGSGHKRLFRDVNYKNINRISMVMGVSYDPYRTSFVSTNFDIVNKQFFNSVSMLNFSPGTLVKENGNPKDSSINKTLYHKNQQLLLGYRAVLQRIPIGSVINSISIKDKVTYAKAAGAKAQLIRVDDKSATIKLSTGSMKKVPAKSTAIVGIVSNDKHRLIIYGKAGRKRNLSRRPIVRGIAMNPVDHPHGGRSNGGRPSVSPWGILTKCKFRLRKKKKKHE